MRGNISSCLLALILGFNVTAVMSRRGSFSIPRVRPPVHKPLGYVPRPPVYVPHPPVYNLHPPQIKPRSSVSNPRLNPDKSLCYRESAVQLPAIQPEECQKPFNQNMSIILSCPPSVEGNVTWSRETNGSRVDILTADGDKGKKHIRDPDRRFSLLAKKSLVIYRVSVSDAGRYFCNGKAAGELTVMNSDHDLMDEVSTVNYGILVPALFVTAFIVFLVLTVCCGRNK